MGKYKIKKGSFSFVEGIDEKEAKEKEVYLRELGNSVHGYIRTGVKNRQLDDLIELEINFQERYEKRFDIGRIVQAISENSKEVVDKKAISDYNQALETLTDSKRMQEVCNSLIQETSDRILNVVTEVVNNTLQDVLRDAAYLSHMNMLYELYEQEEKLRREEAEYEKISERYQHMADITRLLSKKKRMELEDIQRQTHLSQEELEGMLRNCDRYFNMRDKADGIQVSLSPTGKKYNEYFANERNLYSAKALNQLVYKNCDNLMDSIDKTCTRGVTYEPHFEHIPPEEERTLQFKYDKIMKKLAANEENDAVYIISETEKESDNGEKNRFIIPKWWEKEVF